MKSVILVRHGKSSWEYDVSDRDRPLKARGRNDAELVVNQFLRLHGAPKNIYSSPANRALSTCRVFIKSFGLKEDSVNIVEDLYDFGGDNVIKFMRNLPNEIDEIMVFGHNHAFTSITNIFGSIFIDNLPTSGLVKINFDVDEWEAIIKGETKLILIPKELK